MDWTPWLRQTYQINDGTLIQTHKWVEYVVRDGILPLLASKQYDLVCKPEELANCILNHLIRHDYGFKKCKYTSYRCKHLEEVLLEEYEFFEDSYPESVWKGLRRQFYVQHFADEGLFADRVWMNLPMIVFEHVSLASPAFDALYEKHRHLDEEDEDSSENELLGPGVRSERE